MVIDKDCESIAFPLISSGVYGYPKDQALRVAVDIITSFLVENDILVCIVIFDKTSFQISEKLFSDITSYIDDKYVDTHLDFSRRQRNEWGESTLLAETLIIQDEETDDLLDLRHNYCSSGDAEVRVIRGYGKADR